MKKKLILFFCAVSTFSSCAHKSKVNSTEPFTVILEKELKIEKIQKDVYVATALKFYNANTLIARMEDGTVVLASSPYENLGTQILLKWINKHLYPKKIVAINTHFHADGTGGNQIYHEMGVQTWATEETAKKQIEESAKILPMMIRNQPPDIQERIRKTKFEPAKNLFKEEKGKVFLFSKQKVQVYHPGAAHSPDNVIVYIPSKKVLFGGCMVKPKSLGWLRYANVEAWEQSARNLLQFDAEQVVPGHGKWGGKSLITKTIEVAKNAAGQKGIQSQDFH